MAWNRLKSMFVVPDASKDSADAALAELEKYQVPPDARPGNPVPETVAAVPQGELDFQAIYDQAGIPNTDEVEAVERFLSGLDDALPQGSKLAAAKAFLGAIGKAPAAVLEDAARKITVVRTIVDAKRADVEKASDERQAAVSSLQKQMEEHRAAIEQLQRELETVRSKCAVEEARLQGARMFFGVLGDAKPEPGRTK